ncbi:IclR family transcriptional regulator [Streptomyces griseiscabiei]|uniref:IclR family transcriptional regulator n=1 Tax=Streptomyces griseiscabiei TaxID=2993540 RepID=A0ABU4LLJ1_9ACTN|nr:IclR family transcriptional regulator [Streptomyces griseiscabiei]MBZ3900354.1 IclR family transcriptional regulator [Streptomyces griseiscabiei]MDX2916315.1 IclR family transcriptional regulator [Streptomyces griseiscabiei]
MSGNTSEPGRSVSSRLLAVLGAFDISRPTLSLTEVAALTGLPLSTSRRLLKELADWGALERLPDQRYRVGLRLWRLGSLAPQQRNLRDAALPFMQDLCEATQENVQLVVLDGLEALCIERISAAGAVSTKTVVGGRLPLHATGVGKVLLALSPPEVLQATLHNGLPRITRFTVTEPGRLARSLQDVRRARLAFSQEEMTLGAVSVAAPVLGRDDRVLAALGIVTRSRARLERLAPAVRAAALGVSRVCAAREL